MSKYADIEQIKEVIRTEWVKYMPSDLDVNLSFVLGKIAEVPTIDIVTCDECKCWIGDSEWYEDREYRRCQNGGLLTSLNHYCAWGERSEE